MTNGLVGTIKLAGPMGQFIVGFLFCLSVYSWALVIRKLKILRRSEEDVRKFMEFFNEYRGDPTKLYLEKSYPRRGPLSRIFETGCREFLDSGHSRGSLNTAERLSDSVSSAVDSEELVLEKSLTVLATASSMSPFIGLFGTVWGIMRVFSSMGTTGSASIATVAPGISAALITTVAGLAVAIPALAFYNMFGSRIQTLRTQMESFSRELLHRLEGSTYRHGALSR